MVEPTDQPCQSTTRCELRTDKWTPTRQPERFRFAVNILRVTVNINWLHKLTTGKNDMSATPSHQLAAPPARFHRRPRRCESQPTGEFLQTAAAAQQRTADWKRDPCDSDRSHAMSSSSLGRAHYNRLIGKTIQQELGCDQDGVVNMLPVDFEELWHLIVPKE